MREGAELFAADRSAIGRITSGGFGPSLNGPVAMGYVPTALAAAGSVVTARVREREIAMQVAPTPFVANRYFRSKA